MRGLCGWYSEVRLHCRLLGRTVSGLVDVGAWVVLGCVGLLASADGTDMRISALVGLALSGLEAAADGFAFVHGGPGGIGLGLAALGLALSRVGLPS